MKRHKYELRYQPMIGVLNDFGQYNAHIYDTKHKEAILIGTCCRDHNEALNQSIEISEHWNKKYDIDATVNETMDRARRLKISQVFDLKRYF